MHVLTNFIESLKVSWVGLICHTLLKLTIGKKKHIYTMKNTARSQLNRLYLDDAADA